MDNLDGDKIIEEAEKSLERLSRKIEQLEYDSKRDVLKQFDRFHDKLFMFNTIFITGYFASVSYTHLIYKKRFKSICGRGFAAFQ